MHRLIALMLLFGLAFAQQFNITGRVTYAASYNLGRWEGSNSTVRGSVTWNAQSGEASGRICVELARFESGNPLRDADGRGVFDTNKNPQSCMEVQRLSQNGSEATLQGQLEISGVRKVKQIVGQLVKEGNNYRFSGKFSTSFSDWNLTRPQLLFLTINDPIEVRLEALATAR